MLVLDSSCTLLRCYSLWLAAAVAQLRLPASFDAGTAAAARSRRDGVDRSNGFEALRFRMLNDKSTAERDMKQWMTSQYE